MKKSPAKSQRKNGKSRTATNPNGAGRPSSFSPEVAEQYCERLRTRSQSSVCEDPDMPDHKTIARWEAANPEFARECARSIQARAEYMARRVQDVADKSTWRTAPADRVKLSAYQWLAEKLDHNKYGSKSRTELTGANGGPIEVKRSAADFSDDELAAIAARGGSATPDETEGEGESD